MTSACLDEVLVFVNSVLEIVHDDASVMDLLASNAVTHGDKHVHDCGSSSEEDNMSRFESLALYESILSRLDTETSQEYEFIQPLISTSCQGASAVRNKNGPLTNESKEDESCTEEANNVFDELYELCLRDFTDIGPALEAPAKVLNRTSQVSSPHVQEFQASANSKGQVLSRWVADAMSAASLLLSELLRSITNTSKIARRKHGKVSVRESLMLGDLAAPMWIPPPPPCRSDVVRGRVSETMAQRVMQSDADADATRAARDAFFSIEKAETEEDQNVQPTLKTQQPLSIMSDNRPQSSISCDFSCKLRTPFTVFDRSVLHSTDLAIQPSNEKSAQAYSPQGHLKRLNNEHDRRAQAVAKLKSPYVRPQCQMRHESFLIDDYDSYKHDKIRPAQDHDTETNKPQKKSFQKHVLFPRSQRSTNQVNDDYEFTTESMSSQDDNCMQTPTPLPRASRFKRPFRPLSIKDNWGYSSRAPADENVSILASEVSEENWAVKPTLSEEAEMLSSSPSRPEDLWAETTTSCPTTDYTSVSQSDVGVVERPRKIRKTIALRQALPSSAPSGIRHAQKYTQALVEPLSSTRMPSASETGHSQTSHESFVEARNDKESIGWETAGGTKLHIAHDPALAAEWSSPMILPGATSEIKTPPRSARLPLHEIVDVHSELRVLTDRYLLLQKEVQAMKDLVKQADCALNCEARQEEMQLQALTVKWRYVAQGACEQLFDSSRRQVDQAGGLREWQRVQRQVAGLKFARTIGPESDEGEYDLTREEEEAMGAIEDEFTMTHFLQKTGIPGTLIGWDIDLCSWKPSV